MEIKRDHIIGIVFILAIVWVYTTWDKNERFEVSPREYQKEYVKWGQQVYSDNPYNLAIPSIVNYDNTQYKFPTTALQRMKNDYEAKHNHINAQSMPSEQAVRAMFFDKNNVPVAHNMQDDQSCVPGTENISHIGAPINEVLEQELKINGIRPDFRQEMSQESRLDIEQELKGYQEQRPETRMNIEEEPIIQELKMEESAPQIAIPSSEVEQQLMPGMEQKKLMEQEMRPPIVIRVKKGDHNLSLSILLSIALIWFIYHTRE